LTTLATWLRHIAVRTVNLIVTASTVPGRWHGGGGLTEIPTVLIGIIGDNVADVRQLFRFPDPVNETSARLVAAGVVVQAVLFLVLREGWVLVPLTFGFAARVATGPTLSPLGQLVTRVVTPRVEARLGARDASFRSRQVPGRPKRFAQAIGLGFTGLASTAWLLDATIVAYVLIAMLTAAATLEAVFAICLGCIAYSAIWGCADCDDISERLRQALVEARQEAEASAPTLTPAEASAPTLTPAEASAPAMH
jgi:hypothetical protein